ncbi:MAG: serine/threonine transporter SstT [Bifidobacteriaceae bacterium]|jgi:serine/threonine transporter|nr:serine/threonine transporter SstT [Bifidobacteriaceae bacterium]
MGKLVKRWNNLGLITRIVIGLVVGTVFGYLANRGAALDWRVAGTTAASWEWIGLIGQIFVGALKAVAPILVFVLVISALAGARAEVSMRLIIVLYLASTFVAALVAAGLSFVFPIQLTLADQPDAEALPSGIGEVLQTLLLNVVRNPVESLANANYLGILAWAIVIGIALRRAGEATLGVVTSIAEAIARVVRWIIALAPFGVFGLVYQAVYENGAEVFTVYGKLVALLVGCMAVIALGANPLMVWVVLRRNPYRLVLRCLKESGLMAFFTRSSAANIPVNLELARRLGLDRDTYSVSIPLGATVNMAGAAVTITVMAMAASHTMGVRVDFVTAVVLCVLAAISAAGASGVPGGSLMLIPLACSLFGLSADVAMQVVGIGFIIGVIQDSCETALNSSSDVLFTATAEYRLWNREGKKYRAGQLVLT